MAHRLDVVPIWADDKGRIVVRVVLRPKTWRSVVFASSLECCEIESFDLASSLCGESQVEVGRLSLGSSNAEGRVAVRSAEFNAERPLRDYCYAKRRKRLEEEGLRFVIVADTEYDVIEHLGLESVEDSEV